MNISDKLIEANYPSPGEVQACENTDKHLWPEISEEQFPNTIHVTAQGSIGINCGGSVYVKKLRAWHGLAVAAERTQVLDWEADLDSAGLIENQLLEALRPMAERAKSFNDGPDDVWALHAKAGEYNVKEARCAATAYAALVDKGTQGRDWQAIETQLATDKARIEELKEALGDICKDSNPDWVEKRVYPNDILDDIHSVAVEAYYSKKHMNKQSR